MSTEVENTPESVIEVPKESFKDTVYDRMKNRITRQWEHSPQSRTLKDFLAAPLIMGGVCSITVGIPLDALVQLINRDVGMILLVPIIGGSASLGAAYAFWQELILKD